MPGNGQTRRMDMAGTEWTEQIRTCAPAVNSKGQKKLFLLSMGFYDRGAHTNQTRKSLLALNPVSAEFQTTGGMYTHTGTKTTINTHPRK